MPIKFRCPHCFRTLLADEETVGQPKPCPACGRLMHVPTPIESGAPPVVPPRLACPRCRTEAAPTATFCRRCFTVFSTGKRMPWRERLPHVSWQYWALVAGVAVVTFLVLLAGVQYVRIHTKARSATPIVAAAPPDLDAASLATALLGATSEAERQAALGALAGSELRVMPAISAALEESAGAGQPTLERTRNQLAAIELMVRHRDAPPRARGAWIESLKRLEQPPVVRRAALRARGLLGDTDALEPLVELWLVALERALFFERLGALAPRDATGVRVAVDAARRDADRLADGLRRLGQGDDRTVFSHIAARSWGTWDWLAQRDGLGVTGALFDLARPADASLRFDPADVRRPRDIMRALTEVGTPSVQAAAALALVNVPQYRTLTDRVVQTLAGATRGAPAVDQQRLVWVISYLRGKRFTPRELRSPLDVTMAEVAAAQAWVDSAAQPATLSEYPAPPQLSYRAVTPRRQLALELGPALAGDWERSSAALDRWLEAEIGATPRVRDLLGPSQRNPDLPGLAAAMVIAGVSGGAEERRMLELWRDAREQPPWVRALAATALAGIGLREGGGAGGWPGGVDFGPASVLDAKTPGWAHFGRIIAAGGMPMRELVGGKAGAALPADVRAKLLDATARAAERESAVQRP